jgi:hypothetical protein
MRGKADLAAYPTIWFIQNYSGEEADRLCMMLPNTSPFPAQASSPGSESRVEIQRPGGCLVDKVEGQEA